MTIDSLVRDLIVGLTLAHDDLVSKGVRTNRNHDRNRVGTILAARNHREFVVSATGGAYRVIVERVGVVDQRKLA